MASVGARLRQHTIGAWDTFPLFTYFDRRTRPTNTLHDSCRG